MLLREDINLDTSVRASQGSDGALLSPIIRSKLISVHNVASIVTGAVAAAVVHKLRSGKVCAKLLWGGPEVIDRVLLVWEDDTVRNQDAIRGDALTRVG